MKVEYDTSKAVDSRDIKLHYFQNLNNRNDTFESFAGLADETISRLSADNKFMTLASYFSLPASALLTYT